MFKHIPFYLLSIILGAIFIFSGYTKLYPIEPFEYTFVDLGISNWKLAPFIARFFIGLEFFIGAVLILNIKVKESCKVSAAALVLFSVYLLLAIIFDGNKGNCGCFGNYLVMTPLEALIKNALMLAGVGVLYKWHKGFSFKFASIVYYFTLISSMAMPHILNYVDFSYSESYLFKQESNYKLELDTLYNHAEINVPPKKLSSGKHIIAFMSLTCQHCRVAAKKMKIMQERNPDISMYLVLNGKKEMISPFFEDTKSNRIPYCMLLGKPFVFLAGTQMPSIYLVNNSVVEKKVDYKHLDQTQIELWIEKPQN